MRPLRRIYGVPRHSASTCSTSDAHVRIGLGVQSVDSRVMQARLRYYARLVAHRPQMLWAILQSRVNGKPLPWISQVFVDLQFIRKSTLSSHVIVARS